MVVQEKILFSTLKFVTEGHDSNLLFMVQENRICVFVLRERERELMVNQNGTKH
jgi:hypothetical protein